MASREEQRKLLALEIEYLRSARFQDYKKISDTTIRSKMQAGISILEGIQTRKLKWYDHSLEWMIVVGQRIDRTSGEEEGRNNHGRTK